MKTDDLGKKCDCIGTVALMIDAPKKTVSQQLIDDPEAKTILKGVIRRNPKYNLSQPGEHITTGHTYIAY